MKVFELSDPIIAALAAVFGGAGLKLIEWLLNRDKVKIDLAAQIRQELRSDQDRLRQELDGVRSELKDVETQLDAWREKYYELLEQFYEKGIKPENTYGIKQLKDEEWGM